MACGLGLLSFAVYYVTLCPSVYPGSSAQAVATALNLLPLDAVAHPVWRKVAEAVVRIPVLELPFRLNLFGALCGALSVALLFRLARRVLFELICSAQQNDYDADPRADEASESSPAQAAHVADASSATVGGLITALAFAFSAPFWSASACLHPLTFDVFLALLMATFLARYVCTGSNSSRVFCTFLCYLGLLESVIFLAALPVVLFVLFRAGRYHDPVSKPFALLFIVSGLLGLGCGIAALVGLSGADHALSLSSLTALLMDTARGYQADLSQGMPHMGWLLALLETVIPLVVVYWCAPKFLASNEPLTRWLWCLLNATFGLNAARCLLGLPHMPWDMAHQEIPVSAIPALATALTLGALFVYWRLVISTPLLTYESEDYYTPPSRAHRGLAHCVTVFLVATVLVAPFRNLHDADGRKGAFADPVARALIALTGDAQYLVSDGTLDWHLLIQAHLQKRKLTLLHERADWGLPNTGAPAKTTAGVPAVGKGLPTTESPGEFAERWLHANPRAFSQLAVVSQPAVWTRCGFSAVPNGLVYVGATNSCAVNGPALLKTHEALWLSLSPFLAQSDPQPPALHALLAEVNRHVSRIANDLGVYLEDQGCPAEADRAYAQAQSLDADNLCALFNRYGLSLSDPARGNLAELEDQVRAASERFKRGFLFEHCISSCGTLHSQPADLLAKLNATAEIPLVVQWVAYCLSQSPAGSRPRAVTASGANDTASLAQILHAIRAGEKADAEKRLRALLETQPNNLAGWSTLADLLFASGRPDEVATLVLPAMRAAAGEKGDALVDMTEGLFALQQNQPPNARTFFTRALAHRPGLKEAQDQLIRTDRILGDATLTEADALAILKTDASHGEANAVLGSVRLSQKRYDEAEKLLRKSVATLPTAGALADLAELLRNKLRLDEAERFAQHALRLDPGFCQAWDTLGTVLADQNRLNEADSALRRAISLCSKDPRLYLNLARLNLKLNRMDEARQNLTQAQSMLAGAPSAVGKDYDALTRKLDSQPAQR